jgi:NTP pyrophosphatase (non-canonical NTP hydrolase)
MWTLPEYSALFREIYEPRNLWLSREQTLHRLIEEIAEIVKPIFIYNLKEIKWDLPDILAWVCAFSNKCNIDLQEIMIKYIEKPPGKTEGYKLLPFDVIGVETPETLEDWQRYLSLLYKNENANMPPELIISKLIEDVGLTSRKLRTRSDFSEIKRHLAGVIAWTMALASKFDIKLDDVVYAKYPNYCFRCRSKPCRCFKLSTIFISYTMDTKDEMRLIKKMLEDQNLKVFTFEILEPSFRRLRMVEAFDAINRSDGAIVLLKNHYSENVWAETIEILKTIDENNVWICAKKQQKRKRNKLQAMVKDLECSHMIEYYSDEKQLVSNLKNAVKERIEELSGLSKIPR